MSVLRSDDNTTAQITKLEVGYNKGGDVMQCRIQSNEVT